MKTPREIYSAYKIMPSLQLHQLRVAAVGKLICGNFTKPINEPDIVLACLFHDMGNILKFKLGQIPEALEPQGLEYWEGVKEDFKKRYGIDEHKATEAIAQEIGLSEAARTYIKAVKFSFADKTRVEGSFEEKICEYADSRVAPYGVVSLEARLEEGRKRSLSHNISGSLASPKNRYDALVEAERGIEKDIFAQTKIKPEDVTDSSVAQLLEELWEYPVA